MNKFELRGHGIKLKIKILLNFQEELTKQHNEEEIVNEFICIQIKIFMPSLNIIPCIKVGGVSIAWLKA